MDAYWSPAVLIRPVSKCPDPSGTTSMSWIPKRAESRRGGATGNSQKQTNAAAVITASVVRARAYCPGCRNRSQANTNAGTRKCVPP
jgi:hypothetical protein